MKAQYNNGIELLELTVLKDNKDGTLELGNAKGELKVGVCPIDDENDSPKVGHASIIDEPAPAKGASSPSKPAKGASDASDDTDAAAAAVKGKGN